MEILIVGVLAGLGLLALLLWLSTKFPLIGFICMFACALTLTIGAFVYASDKEVDSFGGWLIETLFLAGVFLFGVADACFDTEYYLSTKFDKALLSDDYYATTKLESRGTFWATVGSCIGSAAVILGIIHICCGDNAALAVTIAAWIGVICCGFSIWCIGKFIYLYIKAKREYDEDY